MENTYHDFNEDDRLVEELKDKEDEDEGDDFLLDDEDSSDTHQKSESLGSLEKSNPLSTSLGESPSSPQGHLSRTRTFSKMTGRAKDLADQPVKKLDDATAKLLFDTMTKIVLQPQPSYNTTPHGLMEQLHDDMCRKIARDVIFRVSSTNPTFLLMGIDGSYTDGYLFFVFNDYLHV